MATCSRGPDRRRMPRAVRLRRDRQPARAGSAAPHAACCRGRWRSATTRPRSSSWVCRGRSSTRSSSPPSPYRSACVVASAAGFGLARLPRRPRRIMVAVTVGAAMIPTTALLVGRFSLFRALGITDTLLPLMAPALLGESPFHVLFYLWAFRRISAEIFDAARLEGMSEFGVYWRVAMPLVDRSRSRSPSPASSTCGAPTSSRSCTCPTRSVHGPDGDRACWRASIRATSRCCWPAP